MRQRLPRNSCLACGVECDRPGRRYCSNVCQQQAQHDAFVAAWKSGDETGLTAHEQVSDHVRRYLFDKYGSKCLYCGWAKTNPITGKIPLVVNHIDGNCYNTR